MRAAVNADGAALEVDVLVMLRQRGVSCSQRPTAGMTGTLRPVEVVTGDGYNNRLVLHGFPLSAGLPELAETRRTLLPCENGNGRRHLPSELAILPPLLTSSAQP
jgi:hypothetical protein